MSVIIKQPCRRVPRQPQKWNDSKRVHQMKPDEPAEEDIEIDVLDQGPLASNRVEDLQEQGLQEPLRCDGGASYRRVHLTEPTVEGLETFLDHGLDRSRRMVLRDTLLHENVEEHFMLPMILLNFCRMHVSD